MTDRLEPLVLSLWFNTHGANYVLFEGIYAPVDWGKRGRQPDDRGRDLRNVVELFDLYRPTVLLLQDCADPLLRCPERVAALIVDVMQCAIERNISIYQYGRTQIRACFAYQGACNKDEIAREIIKQLPLFERYVAPMRELWMNEDYHMGMFDALSLIFTYYATERLKRPSGGSQA